MEPLNKRDSAILMKELQNLERTYKSCKEIFSKCFPNMTEQEIENTLGLITSGQKSIISELRSRGINL